MDKGMLVAFQGVVLAKAASRKFISVSRTLRDVSMIDDAINDQEIGTSMLQTLMAGAQAQTVQKDQQFKSDNSLHKKMEDLNLHLHQYNQNVEMLQAEVKLLMKKRK